MIQDYDTLKNKIETLINGLEDDNKLELNGVVSFVRVCIINELKDILNRDTYDKHTKRNIK